MYGGKDLEIEPSIADNPLSAMQSYSHHDSSANSATCKTSCSSNNHDVVYIEDRWPIAKACISEATSQKNAKYGEQTRAVGSSLTGRRVNRVDIRGNMVSSKQTNSLNRHVNHTAVTHVVLVLDTNAQTLSLMLPD